MYISSQAHVPGSAGFPAHVATTFIGVLLSSGLSLCNYALETNFLRKYPQATAIKPTFASKYKPLPASVKLDNATRLIIKITGPAATRSIPPLASKTIVGTWSSTPPSRSSLGLLLAMAILAFIAILVATFRIEPNLRRTRPVDSDASRNSSGSGTRSNGYSFFVPVPDYRATTSRRPGGSGGGDRNPRAPPQNASGSRSAPIKIESPEPPQLTFSECDGPPPPPPPPGPPSPPETVPLPDADDDATSDSSNEFQFILPGFILGFLTGIAAQHLAERRKYRKLVSLVLEDLHRSVIVFAPTSSAAHPRPRPEPTSTNSDCANIIPLTARPRTAATAAAHTSQSVKLDSVEENTVDPDVPALAKLIGNLVLVSAIGLYLLVVFLVLRYTWRYYQRAKFMEYAPRAGNLNLDDESASEAVINDKSGTGTSDADKDIADCVMVVDNLVGTDTTTDDSEVVSPTDIATAQPNATPTQATMTAPQWKYQKKAINHNRVEPVLDKKAPMPSITRPSHASPPTSIFGAPTIAGTSVVPPLRTVSQKEPTSTRKRSISSDDTTPTRKDKGQARAIASDPIPAAKVEDGLKNLGHAVLPKANPVVNSGISASRWAPKVQGSLNVNSNGSRNQQSIASRDATPTQAITPAPQKKFQPKAVNHNKEPALDHKAPMPADAIPSNESLPISIPEPPPIARPSVVLPLASVSQTELSTAREAPIPSDDETPPTRMDKGKARAIDNNFLSAPGTEYGLEQLGHALLLKANPITSGLSESKWAPKVQGSSSTDLDSSRNQHNMTSKSSSTTPPSPSKLPLHDNGTSASVWAPKPEERSSNRNSNSLHNQQGAASNSSTRGTAPPSSRRVPKDDGGVGSSRWARVPDDEGPSIVDSSRRAGGRNTGGRRGNPGGSPYTRPPRGSSGQHSTRSRRGTPSGDIGAASTSGSKTSPSSDEMPKVSSDNHLDSQHSGTKTHGSIIASSGASTSSTHDTFVACGTAEPRGRDAMDTSSPLEKVVDSDFEDFRNILRNHYNPAAKETSIPHPGLPNSSATTNLTIFPSPVSSTSSLNPAAPSFQSCLHIVTGQDATTQHLSSQDIAPDIAESTTTPSSPIRDPYSVFSYLDLHRSDSESDASAVSSSLRRETRPCRTRSCNDIDSVDYDLQEDE